VYPHGCGKVAVPTTPLIVTAMAGAAPTPTGARQETAVTVAQATDKQPNPPMTTLGLMSLKAKFIPMRVKEWPADVGELVREAAERTGASNEKRLRPVDTCTPKRT